jgi:flagellin-like hook-associated protein FlgL
MAISDITLGAGMRQNLSSLQLTSALMARTSERLATGLKVNSAVDDPTAFFAAQSHRARASDLAALKDGMSEAIQTVQAANEGIEAITGLLESIKGLASAARSASDLTNLNAQLTETLAQITSIAGDSGYKGTNLLADGASLTVTFNEGGTSSLVIAGFDGSAGGAVLNITAADFTDIDAVVTQVDDALNALRDQSSVLSANLNVVNARQEFTNGLITTLQVGADKLTVADENEESANMLALQTRQQVAIATMSMSSQASQSILRLF